MTFLNIVYKSAVKTLHHRDFYVQTKQKKNLIVRMMLHFDRAYSLNLLRFMTQVSVIYKRISFSYRIQEFKTSVKHHL